VRPFFSRQSLFLGLGKDNKKEEKNLAFNLKELVRYYEWVQGFIS
jgi:hypothetical protein